MRVPAVVAMLATLAAPALPAAAQAPDPPGEIFGRVAADSGTGIPGVTVGLTGTSDDGAQVRQRVSSGTDGWWKIGALPAGRYSLTEVQPEGWDDGPDIPGTAGGIAEPPDTIAGIELDRGQRAIGYEFTEIARPSRSP